VTILWHYLFELFQVPSSTRKGLEAINGWSLLKKSKAERSALAAIAHAGRGRRRSAKLSREAAWGCGGHGSPRFSFFDSILNAILHAARVTREA